MSARRLAPFRLRLAAAALSVLAGCAVQTGYCPPDTERPLPGTFSTWYTEQPELSDATIRVTEDLVIIDYADAEGRRWRAVYEVGEKD